VLKRYKRGKIKGERRIGGKKRYQAVALPFFGHLLPPVHGKIIADACPGQVTRQGLFAPDFLNRI